MSNENLIKALTKFANKDLSIAAKSGIVCVTNTKLGNLEVTFEGNTFTIRSFMNNEILCVGNRKEAREFLVATYDVVCQ